MKLSILIPVYNERTVVERSLAQVLAAPLPEKHGARARHRRRLLHRRHLGHPRAPGRRRALHPPLPPRRQSRQGRGRAHRHPATPPATSASCRTPTSSTTPANTRGCCGPCSTATPTPSSAPATWPASRRACCLFWHSMINKGLTLISNMFCNLNLTDMETCYKVFRTDLLKSIPIRSNRFGFEPEITMKAAKRKSAHLRSSHQLPRPHLRGRQEDRLEGRHQGPGRDPALLADRRSVRRALRARLAEQPDRHAAVPELDGAPAAAATWATRVLEIGAGIGNLTGRLMGSGCSTSPPRRTRSTCTRCEPLPAHPQRGRARARPGRARRLRRFGEHLRHRSLPERPRVSGRSGLGVLPLFGALLPGGGCWCWFRRELAVRQYRPHARPSPPFLATPVAGVARTSWIQGGEVHQLNRAGVPAWGLIRPCAAAQEHQQGYAQAVRQDRLALASIDALLPWPGLTLVVVARKPA